MLLKTTLTKDVLNDFTQSLDEKFSNTIANLTLSGNNGALSNKSFQDKKLMNNNGGEEGYIYSRLWLNDYLKTINNWDIVSFNERFDIIYDRFLKIWRYPDIEIPVLETSEEENIFTIESPTNKKLEYFIFSLYFYYLLIATIGFLACSTLAVLP